MSNKDFRVILDTNLWISFLISKTLSRLDKSIVRGKLKLIFSEELLQEFIEVSNRPKLKKYFSSQDVSELMDYFDEYGELIQVSTNINLCRDPKDNFLLSLSVDGKADFLITGDKDLLELVVIHKTKILSLADFMILLNKANA